MWYASHVLIAICIFTHLRVHNNPMRLVIIICILWMIKLTTWSHRSETGFFFFFAIETVYFGYKLFRKHSFHHFRSSSSRAPIPGIGNSQECFVTMPSIESMDSWEIFWCWSPGMLNKPPVQLTHGHQSHPSKIQIWSWR